MSAEVIAYGPCRPYYSKPLIKYYPDDSSRQSSWLYCCGAYATPESAEEQAVALTRNIQSRGIIFYHETQGNYDSRHPEEIERQAQLVNELVKIIQDQISNLSVGPGAVALKPRDPFTVISHSFGTTLCKQALMRLSPDERSTITMIALSGITMIPNFLAKEVKNYVSYNDLIANSSNEVLDSEGVLSRAKKVFEKLCNPGMTVRKAILQLCAREAHDEAYKIKNRELYQQTFIMGGSDDRIQKIAIEKLGTWTKLFKEYSIFISADDCPPVHHLGHGEKLDPQEMCDEAVQEMIDLGQKSLKSHLVDHFSGKIDLKSLL